MTIPKGLLSASKIVEETEALSFDRRLEAIIRQAQNCGALTPMATEASVRAGKAAMKLGRKNAARTLSRRIARHDLISEGECAKRLNVSTKWIADALAERRLFCLVGPNDVKYFPAFFASVDIDREALEQVSVKLGLVPAPAKYQFFLTRLTLLRSKTPLEALRAGRLTDVLIAADGYANS